MSKALDRATRQAQAGQCKKAVDTLWEVTFEGDDGEALAHGVIALATQLREETDGGARADCEEHIARARRYLAVGDEKARRQENVAALDRRVREDAISLAREARTAGLTWFELRRPEDLVKAEMEKGFAAPGAAAEPALIDAIEAEGWHLEHVAALFRPTKVQTSPLRGADVFMGGDVVDGDEVYIYLFRRTAEPVTS